MAPVLFLNFTVIILPSAFSIYYAFTKWSGLGTPEFIGLENFQRLVQDRVFFTALSHNIIWTVLFLTLPVGMGLMGAFLLAGIKRGQMFFRVAFFLPYVVASVVNAQLWRYLLNPRFGIGVWLAERGITILDTPVFGNRATSLYAVAFVDGWHFWGFLVVLYLAAMYQVDTELYEVARLEGANRLQQFRHVTLPGIRPTLVFTLLMITISTHLYSTAFDRFEVGYAASIGLVMTFFVAAIVGVFVFLRRRGWEI